MKLDLGNPRYHKGYISVDINPIGQALRYEAIEYLKTLKNNSVEEIRAYNLLEHLPNVGEFFSEANRVLKYEGMLNIRTDNALWFPFYIPLIGRYGIGAHALADYNPKIMNGSAHYYVFTKLHLRNFCLRYSFKIVELKYEWKTLGARLLLKAVKR